MSTKLKSVVSLVAGMAMLMSVGVGTAMTAGAAEAQTPLVQLVEEDGGTTVLDKDTLTDGAGTPWKRILCWKSSFGPLRIWDTTAA